MVRKLKGKAKKENSVQKKERKTETRAAREKLFTVVLPIIGGVVLVIFFLFYWATR